MMTMMLFQINPGVYFSLMTSLTLFYMQYMILRLFIQCLLNRVDMDYVTVVGSATINYLLGLTFFTIITHYIIGGVMLPIIVYVLAVCVPMTFIIIVDTLKMFVMILFWLYKNMDPMYMPGGHSMFTYESIDILVLFLQAVNEIIAIVLSLCRWFIESKAVKWLLVSVCGLIQSIWHWFINLNPIKWLQNLLTIILTIGRFLLSRLEYLGIMFFTFVLSINNMVEMSFVFL
jgi:hypothetical protein